MNIRRRNAATAFGSAIALIAIIAVFVVVLPSLVQPPGPVIGIDTGQVAPAFVIEDVNGTKWNLSEHRGEVILLDFMGSYCAPCADEMKDGSMQSLYDNYSSRGFTILSVDVGGVSGTENPLVAWQFIRGINSDGTRRWDVGRWPVALDNQGLVTTFRVGPIPMMYLLDRSGTIVWKHVGYATPSELRDNMVPLI